MHKTDSVDQKCQRGAPGSGSLVSGRHPHAAKDLNAGFGGEFKYRSSNSGVNKSSETEREREREREREGVRVKNRERDPERENHTLL